MMVAFRLFCLAVFSYWAMSPAFSQKEPYRPADTEEEFQRRYQERIKKDQLNGVYIPKNLDVDGLPMVGQSETKSSNHH